MRTYPLALVVLAVGLLVAAPATAVAQNEACDVVLGDGANGTTGPGGELADAIGEQRSEIGSELDDRRFEARLENATTDEERATNVSDEVERIEAHLEAIETCLESHEAAREAGEGATQLDPREVDTLHGQVQSIHDRFNETVMAATDLPASVRDQHDISTESMRELEQRIDSVRESTDRADEDSQSSGAPDDTRRDGVANSPQ